MTFKLHSALIIQEVSDSNKNKWYILSMISMIWLNSNNSMLHTGSLKLTILPFKNWKSKAMASNRIPLNDWSSTFKNI